MSPQGWKAKGVLRPLWEQLPGKREQLAELTRISATELSSYNSGKKNLGLRNAKRIIAGFAEKDIVVSLVELGGPLDPDDPIGKRLADRLREIEDRVAAMEKLLP